jgi:hypothetical protein
VVAKVRERLAVTKRASQKFDGESKMIGRLGDSINFRLKTGFQHWKT